MTNKKEKREHYDAAREARKKKTEERRITSHSHTHLHMTTTRHKL